jgi:UDP-N-acetylglucosamine 2-epimerase (non-hydrolysing)
LKRKYKLILVAGARPNFMKIAPIVRALRMHRDQRSDVRDQMSEVGEQISQIEYKIVHTGQHYDYEMSQAFFDELEIPKPDYFLEAGSGSHAEQTAKIMLNFEKVCETERPDLVMVVGDVNSTLACSIVAKKMGIEVAHVEAGLRSFDLSMPEEINRIVTDSISDYLFVTEKSGVQNLRLEGKEKDKVFYVGNVMIDTLYYQLEILESKAESSKLKAQRQNHSYAVVTLHRPSNVDSRGTLAGIVEALLRISEDMPVIFPVHPRTRKKIEDFGLLESIEVSNIEFLSPISYMSFLNLWKDASLVLTDSGGLQEETTALGVPCFTIRENTERPVTIEEGTNTLVGAGKEGILSA